MPPTAQDLNNAEKPEIDNDAVDHLADFANTTKTIKGAGGAIASASKIASTTATYEKASKLPGILQGPVQWGLGKAGVGTLTENTASAVQKGASTALSLTPLNTALGGAVAAGHGIQAAKQYSEGDIAEGTGKLLRGAVMGGVIVLNLSGLTIVPDAALRIATGKWGSEYVGDFVENRTTAMLGGTKEEKEAKKIAEANAVPDPVGTAVFPEGMAAAGLTANHVVGANGEQYHIGTLPAEPGEMLTIETPAAIASKQVMAAQYPAKRIEQRYDTANSLSDDQPGQDKPAGYWQERVRAERAAEQGVANPSMSGSPTSSGQVSTSGDQTYAQAVDRAREMQDLTNLTTSV